MQYSEEDIKLNRKHFIELLRTTTLRQIQGKYASVYGYCAIGAGAHTAGMSDTAFEESLGKSSRFVRRVVEMNDIEGLTFSEIADRLEQH